MSRDKKKEKKRKKKEKITVLTNQIFTLSLTLSLISIGREYFLFKKKREKIPLNNLKVFSLYF